MSSMETPQNVSSMLHDGGGGNGSTAPDASEGPGHGEPTVGPRWQAFIIALYGLTTVLAFVGNAVVVWVLAMGRRACTDISAFLINLALADLTMALFCLPFTFTEVLLQSWLFSALLCPVVRFAQTLSVSVSIYTLTTIGIDRYYAVCHPLHSRMTKSRGKVLIALIWAVSISISSVQLGISRVGDGKCLEVGWPSPGYQKSYTVALLLGTYLVPLLVLTLAYSSVAKRLWGRRTPGNVDHKREIHQERSKRKVIKMLSVIVLMFAVCWLPLNVFQALLEFEPSLLPQDAGSATAIYFCAHFLAMSHSMWNPLVYGFYNDSFRADLRHLCARMCSCLPCLHCRALCKDSMEASGDSSKVKKQKSSNMSLHSSSQGRKTLPLGSSVRTYLTVDTVPQMVAERHPLQPTGPSGRSYGRKLENPDATDAEHGVKNNKPYKRAPKSGIELPGAGPSLCKVQTLALVSLLQPQVIQYFDVSTDKSAMQKGRTVAIELRLQL